MVEDILAERSKTHGIFFDNAYTSVQIKNIMRETNLWNELLPDQQESLDCIAAKISRILTGNSEHVDSWRDIAGYATLVAKRIELE